MSANLTWKQKLLLLQGHCEREVMAAVNETSALHGGCWVDRRPLYMASRGWEKTKAFRVSNARIDHQSIKHLKCLTPEQLQWFSELGSFWFCFVGSRSQQRTNRLDLRGRNRAKSFCLCSWKLFGEFLHWWLIPKLSAYKYENKKYTSIRGKIKTMCTYCVKGFVWV